MRRWRERERGVTRRCTRCRKTSGTFSLLAAPPPSRDSSFTLTRYVLFSLPPSLSFSSPFFFLILIRAWCMLLFFIRNPTFPRFSLDTTTPVCLANGSGRAVLYLSVFWATVVPARPATIGVVLADELRGRRSRAPAFSLDKPFYYFKYVPREVAYAGSGRVCGRSL